jgi:23S rRNA (adenine2030-N6)-methyltransferase
MNYRHAFHAGNHGDVLKHIVLTRTLHYLLQKDSPLAVLDAHAAIGRYDLTSLEALKTSEWRGGIGKLSATQFDADAQLLLTPYLNILRDLNPSNDLTTYPGSPEIAARMLRPSDRLLLNELHPADFEELQTRYRGRKNTVFTSVDAGQAVRAALPFIEKRGLVLIDPAFEVTDETLRVQRMLLQGLKRMAHACFLIWYPVTTLDFADTLCSALEISGARSALRAEVLVRAPEPNAGLAGSGVVAVNPPWTLHQDLTVLLPQLTTVLAETNAASSSLRWLLEPR